jgi:hypothetical protein
MGYYVSATLDCVRIPPEQVTPAAEALRALMTQAARLGASARELSFAWVNTHSVLKALDAGGPEGLVGALDEWRYEASLDKDGSVIVEDFRGTKYGTDALLWQALAPCLDAGGSISWRGEDDDDLWRFEFTGAGMKTMTGQITWREDV